MHSFRFKKQRIIGFIAGAILAAVGGSAFATGMQPETSVIILKESDRETSINITNTDNLPSLLYSTIEDTPEDGESLVLLTPPVARVDPGETQLVRFLLKPAEPVKVQRLKRAVFEGFPQRSNPDGSAVIGVTLRQNLPLIVHPKGLELIRDPWKLLSWRIQDNKLVVINDSAYVVRLNQAVQLLPSGKSAMLPRAYILPGETLIAQGNENAAGTSVKIKPATVFGYAVDSYEAAISASPK